MPAKRTNLLLGEIHESFSMAFTALTAHKLRLALTLLGVLIGVFSIIVVMTAMRVLQVSAERGLSELGSQTFAIQRWPEATFGDQGDWQKYRRRPYVTLAQGRQVEAKATLAAVVGIEGDFWMGKFRPALPRHRRASGCTEKRPGVFQPRIGTLMRAGFLPTTTWTTTGKCACWAAPWPRRFSLQAPRSAGWSR